MRALIAGGCGFVGMNIAEAILRRGDDAVLFDANPLHREAARAFDLLPGAYSVEQGDVRNVRTVAAAFINHEIDAVFYGAAMTSGPERERASPDQVLGVNLLGLVNVINAATKAGVVKRVINISSGSAYGRHRLHGDGDLVEEVTPSEPETLYGITKHASEAVCRRLTDLLSMDTRSVRLAAVYGPWEVDSGARDTLSPFMQAALVSLSGETAILPRADRQDWVYSRDVATALLALMDAEAPDYNLYHIASNQACGVQDWCSALKSHYRDFNFTIATSGQIPNINLHGDKDRRSLSGARLSDDIGHTLPSEPTAAFQDFLDWIIQHGAFWSQ